MPRTAGDQVTFTCRWELHCVDIQTVGFDLEHNLFIFPIPDCKWVIWCTGHWCQVIRLKTEVYTVIATFRTTAEYTLDFGFVLNHFLDLDVGFFSLFSHCKLVFVRTDANAAYAIAVFALLEFQFHIANVQHLELVTVRGYDQTRV